MTATTFCATSMTKCQMRASFAAPANKVVQQEFYELLIQRLPFSKNWISQRIFRQVLSNTGRGYKKWDDYFLLLKQFQATATDAEPWAYSPQFASSDPSAQSGSSSHTHSLEMQCLVVLHWKWSGEQLFSALNKKIPDQNQKFLLMFKICILEEKKI